MHRGLLHIHKMLLLSCAKGFAACTCIDVALVELSCLKYALNSKYADMSVVCTEQWVRGFRTAAHSQQDTTGACEGFHSALKGCDLANTRTLSNRRLDWLLPKLTDKVSKLQFLLLLECMYHVLACS